MTATATTFNPITFDDGDEVIEPRFFGGLEGVTRREANAAFNLVAPKDNWKNPIDAVVTLDTAGAEARKQLIEQSVIFFTGSIPTFERLSSNADGVDSYRVKGEGYYIAIGA